MAFRSLRWFLLLACVTVQVGCASSEHTADDTNADLAPVPSHDDSHGWGANLQQAGSR